MSRIHEALRKAEEEKGKIGTPTSPVQPMPEEPLMAEHWPHAASAVPVQAAETIEPMIAQTGNGKCLNWDLIATQCVQRAWRPSERMLFLNANSHDHIGMEEFRTLRSRLYRIREQRSLRSILVASALPAEGKSFISANLAQTLARQHGRRVVLVDCDLRRARLHESLGTMSEPGVSDYLRGEVDELSILQRGSIENLAFAPGGKHVSNPAELLGNGRLELLLKRLADVFDWIVIDTPPVVPVSDASLIAPLCDGVLLVVQSAKTPLDLARRARREFQNLRVLGVVLNRVDAGTTYVSYYYGKYGRSGGEPASE